MLEKIATLLDSKACATNYKMEIDWFVVEVCLITEAFQKWDDTNLKERFQAVGLMLREYYSVPETYFPYGPTVHTITLVFDYPVPLYVKVN